MVTFEMAFTILTNMARLVFYVAAILACVKYLRKK